MSATYGNAGSGNLHHGGTALLPGPTPGLRKAHRPWCRDCKRTVDAEQLDDAGRCARCATAHAEAEARAELRARVARQIDAEERAARQPDRPVVKRAPAKPKPRPKTPRKAATRKPRTPKPPRTGKPGRRALPVNEPALVDAYRAGATLSALAAEHHIGLNRVRAILDANGGRTERRGGRNRLTDTERDALRDQAVARYTTGASIATIATETGRHPRVITRALLDAGVTLRPAAHLRHQPRAAEVDAEIVQRYAAGECLSHLATRYHLRQETVREIVTAAGLTVRPKGNAAGIRARTEALGTTAAEVRSWARENDVACPTAGLLPMGVLDAYAAAHEDA